ncbi:MAG: CRTAC1 family protein [Bacteroidales bacterium]|nr:CRTAC1 family protein [Bacteroidales bacterium]
MKNYFCLLSLIILLSACSTDKKSTDKQASLTLPAANDDYFQEITDYSGINFIHSIGDDHLSNIVESVGGGAAFLDYDQDGFIDLYVCNGAYIEGFSEGEKPEKPYENHLYRNRQDGTFEAVTKKAGVGHTGYGMGITIGDFNNDGFPDIYISNNGPNVLYRNNGNGTFTDISEKAGIRGESCSVGAVWFDYDNDGFLDIYVGNYVYFDPEYDYYYAPDGFPGPMAYDAQADVLYHNNGDETFTDVSEPMGIYNPDGRAMGVGAADYDDDGFVDVFVANDHMVNYLFHNEGGKKFVDHGVMSGLAFNQSGEATISMSVDFADFNNDGLLDLFVSDDSYCSLYRNEGNGVFSEVSNPSGIASAAAQHVGWSSSFIDFDNDGDVDIFKTNGELKHLYGHEDQLFENIDGKTFKEVSVEHGEYFKKELVGRGACFGDYDNDGDIDAYIMNLNDKGVLLRNNKGNENNWLELHLIGDKSNKDGIGARIKITVGDKIQAAQKKSTTGYLSQNDPRLHFGLGSKEKADKIEIIWPSGIIQHLENVQANQILTVKESSQK